LSAGEEAAERENEHEAVFAHKESTLSPTVKRRYATGPGDCTARKVKAKEKCVESEGE